MIEYDPALQIFEHAYGASSVGLCPVMSRLGRALRDAGNSTRIETVAERAVGTSPSRELEVAEAWLAVADVSRGSRRRVLARNACPLVPFLSDQLELDRWLAMAR